MLGLGFLFPNFIIHFIIQIILVTPVIVINFHIYKKGLKSLFRFHPSMESLVSIGTIASLLYSIYSFIFFIVNGSKGALYLDSVSTILVLVQLGKYFETISLNKANDTIRLLLEKTPKSCTKLVNDKEVICNVSEVKIGDILVAKPGDNIAVDGIITNGFFFFFESILTGEAMPIDKKVNDKVYTSTSNLNGVIYYMATAVGSDTEVSKIIKMVEETQMSKAPIERLADKVANVFTKVVLGIAIIAFSIWLIIKKDFSFALNIFVSIYHYILFSHTLLNYF